MLKKAQVKFIADEGKKMSKAVDAKKLAQEQRRKELEEKRNLLKKLREENTQPKKVCLLPLLFIIDYFSSKQFKQQNI